MRTLLDDCLFYCFPKNKVCETKFCLHRIYTKDWEIEERDRKIEKCKKECFKKYPQK